MVSNIRAYVIRNTPDHGIPSPRCAVGQEYSPDAAPYSLMTKAGTASPQKEAIDTFP